MGKQLQVDIGEIWVEDVRLRKNIKLFCIGFVLSHSRFKFGVWYTSLPTTQCLVSAMDDCFALMGGIPKEIVFDQAKLFAYSENHVTNSN